MEPIRYSQEIDYFVEMPGLASTSVGCAGIDGKYALIQVPTTCSLAIAPPIGEDHPQFVEIVFYANCLAYEHDLPVFISPVSAEALRRPIEGGPPDFINRSYFESVGMACEAINAIRLGPLGFVYFRWPGFEEDIELPYTEKYSSVAKEQSLYSTALKQLDPLSEFLNYYRIIESVSNSNGKGWIGRNLPRIKKFDFGFLHFGVDGLMRKPRRRTNLFSVYRRRAQSRLRELQGRFMISDIPKYFYNEIRCGIAHGRTGIKEYDFSYNIREVSRDVYVLKLLSRIAIEDMI
jgi:hypothetical protein